MHYLRYFLLPLSLISSAFNLENPHLDIPIIDLSVIEINGVDSITELEVNNLGDSELASTTIEMIKVGVDFNFCEI